MYAGYREEGGMKEVSKRCYLSFKKENIIIRIWREHKYLICFMIGFIIGGIKIILE
jgi:hypothetical protein